MITDEKRFEDDMACGKQAILVSRSAIKVIHSCMTTFPQLEEICREIIATEQENIRVQFDELVNLRREHERALQKVQVSS